MATCPFLDDLFAWAAQQPAANTTSVKCNLATNQSTWQGQDKNLVSYAEGILVYNPGGWIKVGNFNFLLPPSFAGKLTQYFSDRRYASPPSPFVDNPFDASNTDPLDLSISASVLILENISYSVSIQSPKWGFTQSFAPQCEAGTIYGIVGNVELAVISLCQRASLQIN